MHNPRGFKILFLLELVIQLQRFYKTWVLAGIWQIQSTNTARPFRFLAIFCLSTFFLPRGWKFLLASSSLGLAFNL